MVWSIELEWNNYVLWSGALLWRIISIVDTDWFSGSYWGSSWGWPCKYVIISAWHGGTENKKWRQIALFFFYLFYVLICVITKTFHFIISFHKVNFICTYNPICLVTNMFYLSKSRSWGNWFIKCGLKLLTLAVSTNQSINLSFYHFISSNSS